jgi:F-type H+-transporting ATPase subunit delta
MKATATQYAKALYEATKDKDQKGIDGILTDFVKVLSKNNQTKLAGNVSKKFGEVYNKENGIVEAEVTSARKLESYQVHKVESFLKDKYKAKKVEINNIIDKRIKGGIVIKVGDEVMDGSVDRKLRNLKIQLEK